MNQARAGQLRFSSPLVKARKLPRSYIPKFAEIAGRLSEQVIEIAGR